MFLAFIVFTSASIYKIYSRGTVKHSGGGDTNTIEVVFFDEKRFNEGVHEAQIYPSEEGLVGGVIPHHTLAAPLISEFMMKIPKESVRRVIVLGPNHYEVGGGDILTSEANWRTPFGMLKTDVEFIRKLGGRMKVEDELIANEHSVSAIMPYISYYLGSPMVVPLVVSNKMDTVSIERFSNILIPLLDEETLVIGAFDFSHYLTLEDAREKDEETLSIIKDFSYPKLSFLGNEHTDSTAALAILLILMEDKNTSVHVYGHANSLDYASELPGGTTSYFSIGFVQ